MGRAVAARGMAVTEEAREAAVERMVEVRATVATVVVMKESMVVERMVDDTVVVATVAVVTAVVETAVVETAAEVKAAEVTAELVEEKEEKK